MKISDKHGLNPSINVCFFCGKDKGELLFFGRLKGDAKAPQRVMANYKPCKECEAKMSKGVTVIEVTRTDSGAVPIQPGAWPTGRWSVIKKEAAQRLFKTDSTKILLEDRLYNELIKSLNRT